ncbi:hypothetical protein TIFTF001_022443 [Ficus carica]|uniref:TF-B3 domain-containing protein n=1 Tax=Ficus carica TaxID=3494 RepID=A0AA88DBQ2_FICCA|nr:hypothetical protein TIFTF001_022443 [Ficus carica]
MYHTTDLRTVLAKRMDYYEKTLSKTDIQQKLIVLTGWLGNLLPVPIPGSDHAIPIRFTDELGKDYTFRLTVRSPRPGELRYDMKPEFMFKEWHAFVVEKNLQVGESIFLWWDDRGHFRIRVREPPALHRLFATTFLH